jgi:two-component system LytT family response regulator
MLRALLVDDEMHVRKSVAGLIHHFCPKVVLVGEADSVESGLQAIRLYKPNLLLLDIQMGDGTGFDLLKKIDNIDFRVIFITAYEQYAVQAFKFSAIDYILKPVDPEDLMHAISRVENLEKEETSLRLSALEENLAMGGNGNKKLVIRTADNIHLVNQLDILYCEADGNYTTIQLKHGQRIVTSRLLKDFEEMLTGSGFYRVHKSFLINFSAIDRFEKADGGYIVLQGGHKVPVASRKKEELISLFEQFER